MTVVRRSSRPRVLLLSIVIVLLLFFLAELVWDMLLSPRLVIRKIKLESDLSLSDGQLMEMLNLGGDTWASLDEVNVQKRLESYPVVRKARVVKVFPDTLKIYIYRRRPLAAALFSTEGKPVPAVFDEEGYAVQIGTGSEPVNLPIISGPRFSEPSLGSRLPESICAILSDLSQMRSEDSHLFALISEIEIIPHGNGNYDLKLYMNHIPIPIMVDHKLTVESVRQAVLVLDVLASGNNGDIEEADMRGGHVVYRQVEGS